jgi:hypothetical protein
MSCQIQFKTAFNNNYDKITFDGDSLPLAQIKLLIIEKSKFNKSIEFDLEITNADTNEGKSNIFFCCSTLGKKIPIFKCVLGCFEMMHLKMANVFFPRAFNVFYLICVKIIKCHKI